MLTGRLLRSKYPKAKILGVKLPELPEGYFYVDSSDVPGNNYLVYSKDDSPVFCENTAEYIGDTIGMIVGPDETEVERLVKACEVDYEVLEPVVDVRKSTDAFFDYSFGHGISKKPLQRRILFMKKSLKQELKSIYTLSHSR